MSMYDIIEIKKNKKELSKEQIEYFVENYTNGTIPDYQASALLMAIVIQGMSDEEAKNLTLAMANSGDLLDLSGIKGNIVDKHSTGGVGDKTSLIIAPIVASLGGKVAKMSGRGLGFTGGTIDKLESISVRTELSNEEFIKQVNDINISIIGQTKNIDPADKKIYALRDVTATIDSIPLIASSIMSKKIASGSKNLVLDIKVGSGAFMKSESSATALAKSMVNIGALCGINVIAILTNMNIPLGNNIGNLLEIEEVIEVLNNRGPEDLKEVCITLASNMNALCNNVDIETSKKQVIEVLANGTAYKKFIEFINRQGGKLEINKASYEFKVYSEKEGYINKMNTENIGKISCVLGSGRIKKEDVIDFTAGIVLNKKTGDYVNKNDLLCTLYSSKINNLEKYKDDYLQSIIINSEKPEANLIIDIIKA